MYQTVYKGRMGCDLEIRRYPPIKRTITVARRQYFLQFPPMLVARLGSPYKSKFFAAFCDEKGGLRLPPFGGCSSDFSVCLDGKYHYDWPANASLERMLSVYWQTDFGAFRAWSSEQPFGGRLHNWANLNLEEVMEEVGKLSQKCPENQFIQNLIQTAMRGSF